ncbi:MAG: ABC transporter permease, partial [Flavobacteriales bacterium]
MSQHRIVIEPGSLNRNYWRDFWQYRGLLFFLAWRDVKVRYKQTAIGVLWSVIRPAITIGAMWFIGWLFGSMSSGAAPRILVVCAAVLPWQFFASAFSETANSLITNSNLLTKVYFPRMIVPVSAVVVSIIDLAISLIIFTVLALYYAWWPGVQVALLPLFLFIAIFTSFGIGVLIAALNVKYRDFRYLIPVMVQFGLYLSPVAFTSQDILAHPSISSWMVYVYYLNPMAGVIDGFRYCLLGDHYPLFT